MSDYYAVNDASLTAIGDAIRTMEDSSEPISLGEMPTRIRALTNNSNKLVSDNLHDANQDTENVYLTLTGEIANYNNWSATDYIPVKPGCVYMVKAANLQYQQIGSAYNGFFTSDKIFVQPTLTAFGDPDKGPYAFIRIPDDPQIAYVMFSSSTATIKKMELYETNITFDF